MNKDVRSPFASRWERKEANPQDGPAKGFGLAAAGAGLGLAGALIVCHLMAGLLYGVSPTDLPTFAGVTLVLTTVALAASYIPARRAMRLDPITTLHAE
jgi:ABC-type antimicrobial peptide transport system permease subunit